MSWGPKAKGEGLCRHCGESATDLHHVIFRSRQPPDDLRNGLPLCHECHMGFHDGTITLHRELFRPHELPWLLEYGGVWFEDRYPERGSALPF